MKFPLEWLNEIAGHSYGADEVSHAFTFGGLEVEEVEKGKQGAILDLSITPNRGDCLSLYGLAREIRALSGKAPLKKLQPLQKKGASRPKKGPVTIRAKKGCRRYIGQEMTGIKIKPSPQWLQKRLEACGIRSINNVVDATNYVMLERGHPLHAFDREKLSGGKIDIRWAGPQETLVTLDGQERRLKPDDLVIADQEKVIALAGIMGGHESEVDETTTTLFLEAAWFDPEVVRKTRRRLGISTESSYRFERAVDWYGTQEAMKRLIELLEEITEGETVGAMIDIQGIPPQAAVIDLALVRVESLLGVPMKNRDSELLLKRIGCQLRPHGKDRWKVTVPTYRPDLTEEVDLIEEIARLKGYETIPSCFPAPSFNGIDEDDQPHLLKARQRSVEHLISLGFTETVHYSFCAPELLASLGDHWKEQGVALANPLSQELSVMRPTLLGSLLDRAQYHHHRQMEHLRLFECQTVFADCQTAVEEHSRLAGILTGESQPQHWGRSSTEVDFYEAKGVVESLLALNNHHEVSWSALPKESPYYDLVHPSRSALLTCQGEVCGVVGEIHPRLLETFALKGACALFELVGPVLLQKSRQSTVYHPYSAYPTIHRDLALLLDETTTAQTVIDLVAEQERHLIQAVEIFDLYRGDSIPVGKKSLGLTLRFGCFERSLTDEEADQLMAQIQGALKKQLQAEVR